MLIETENYIYKNFKKNKNKILKLLFPLTEGSEWTEKEIIRFVNESVYKEDNPLYRDSVGDEECSSKF